MKTILFLLLIPFFTFCQDKPFKGANRILVPVADTSNVMQRITLALYKNGYSIENKDPALYFISTKSKGVDKTPAELTINSFVKADTIVLSGSYSYVLNGVSAHYNLAYGGMKGSMLKTVWEELERVAVELGNNLRYKKE